MVEPKVIAEVPPTAILLQLVTGSQVCGSRLLAERRLVCEHGLEETSLFGEVGVTARG